MITKNNDYQFMNFIYQTKFDTPGGNCMQACIASILGIEIDDAPHFFDTCNVDWLAPFAEWVIKDGHGSGVVTCDCKDGILSLIEGFCIMGVRCKSAKESGTIWTHAVVGRTWLNDQNRLEYEIIHDPLPPGMRRDVAEVVNITWIVKNVSPWSTI